MVKRKTRKQKNGKYTFNFGVRQDKEVLFTALGQLEDICEDVICYTDGESDGQETYVITIKRSDLLDKLLEDFE